MAEAKRGVIAGFFIGLWNLINFARRFVFNLIFIILLVAFVMALRSGTPNLQAHTALVLDPDGNVLLEGLGRYRTYYKQALDTFGVDVHLFRVGEYKSAAEPFIRNDSSPEAKEADLFWMNGVWNDYLADVAAARKLDPKQIA